MEIFHNPRCSKSRQTLALLREHGVEPTVVEYLDTPLSADRINAIIDALGIEAHALLRTKESAYKDVGLSSSSSRAEIVRAMTEHPILMERPVVVHGEKAVLGRPPENVLSLLDE